MIIDQKDRDLRIVRFAGGLPVMSTEAINGKRLRLAESGKTLSVNGRETWERQDPLPGEILRNGFDARAKLDEPGRQVGGSEDHFLRCTAAYAFNDIEQAERECLAAIRAPGSSHRGEARDKLAEVYSRNGMVRKAVEYGSLFDRMFYRFYVAKYPEMTVTHRGYGRVQLSEDSMGHILLPVRAAGKESSYVIDTGANRSIMRASEARRLGLRLERAHINIINGVTKVTAHLTIVPIVEAGATRLENVPFWVLPDSQLEWPGVIGIDALLKLETLRRDKNLAAEIGFPGEKKDIRKANLCFSHDDVLTEVSGYGQTGLIFFVDTGTPATEVYTRFAAQFPDLASANGKLAEGSYVWAAFGKERAFNELRATSLELNLGGVDITLRDAGVLLERRPGQNERHGILGMDLFHAAAKVTLDFGAMRMSLEFE